MQLANPIASLRTMPIQLNYDEKIGPNDEGSVWRLNVQPVIPFDLNEDWYLITRTIAPIVQQENITAIGDSQFGIGDILQSFFFSPDKTIGNGWTVGGGPVVLYPSATDDSLGAEKWALGPTAVGLKQEGPWTIGALGNHIWSIGGPHGREDINLTYSRALGVLHHDREAATLSLNAETNYDWQAEDWLVPLQFTAEQLLSNRRAERPDWWRRKILGGIANLTDRKVLDSGCK